ncbi:hypothetical protein M9H77_17009 [Catharanthus roseus]|uniref:Uncharacterized protein n=1 Tax=Catharanthus roseus TaxID=4058 RepID=A0ACC0B3C1_CATRO|nr:hypothetical protein M9H77_17009 [Catharanthus roseus]
MKSLPTPPTLLSPPSSSSALPSSSNSIKFVTSPSSTLQFSFYVQRWSILYEKMKGERKTTIHCNQRRAARVSLLLSAIIASLIGCAAASGYRSSTIFAEEDLIRQFVSDGLLELETSFLQVIRNTCHSISFARIAQRYEVD